MTSDDQLLSQLELYCSPENSTGWNEGVQHLCRILDAYGQREEFASALERLMRDETRTFRDKAEQYLEMDTEEEVARAAFEDIRRAVAGRSKGD